MIVIFELEWDKLARVARLRGHSDEFVDEMKKLLFGEYGMRVLTPNIIDRTKVKVYLP